MATQAHPTFLPNASYNVMDAPGDRTLDDAAHCGRQLELTVWARPRVRAPHDRRTVTVLLQDEFIQRDDQSIFFGWLINHGQVGPRVEISIASICQTREVVLHVQANESQPQGAQ